jgi:Dolichyl-phosphate-mannose-protein mannosyltransferase
LTVVSKARTATLIVLASVAVLGVLVRVPTIAEPIGIDQGLLASGAKAVARGQALYRDVWDQKPPAIFLTYVAGFTVFGWKSSSLAWLDLTASAVILGLLFVIVRAIGGVLMGTVAAALYSVLTMPSWLYPARNGAGILERSVPEIFITACVAAGAWCAVRLRSREKEAIWAAGLGLCAGAAIAYKPNAGVYLPALLGWVMCYRSPPRRIVFLAVVAGLAAVVFPLLTVVWLGSLGVLPDARVALIDFNRFYVAQGFSTTGFAITFSRELFRRIKTDPLWFAGALGAVVALWELARARKLDPVPALAILWGAAAAAVIVVNGVQHLFNTYFIQAFAPLAVLAAWLLAGVAERSAARKVAAAVAIVVVAVLLWTNSYPTKVFGVTRADLDQLLGRGDRAAYLERFGGYATGRGYSARANAELADYIRDHTARDDRIFQFGISSAGIYFEADRLMAQRFLRANEFVPSTFPMPGFDLAAVTRELAQRAPVYLIFEQLHATTEMGMAVDRLQEAPEIAQLLDAYRLETRIEDFTVYRRK